MENDGGPAFPVTFEHSYGEGCGTKSQEWQGMSLRDYFAATALTGLIINNSTCTERCPIDKRAYELADAMLAARTKPLTSKE